MREMIKVVFDTNIYISLFSFPGKTNLNRLWELAVSRRFELYVSPFILNEFRKVCLTKFHFEEKDIDFFMERILSTAHVVEPSESVDVIPEKHADNEILACAVAAEADVSCNRRQETSSPPEIVPRDFYRLTE